MSPWRLALLETRGRPLSAVLVALVVAAAVALALGARWTGAAASRETRRVQRDLGFNLRVLPRSADLDRFLLQGYCEETMPLDVVDRLAQRRTLSYNHLVAALHRRVEVGGKDAIVTGVTGTLFPSGKKKPPMQPTIAEGTTHLGAAIAERLGVGPGAKVELLSEPFQVGKVVARSGGADDLRVWLNLSDAQRLLGLAGQISEVRAIDCLCLAPEDDPQSQLRAEIEAVAPETQVVLLSQLATTRARQRRMTDQLAAYAAPLAALAGGIGVGAIGVYNVRQRRQEFAMLRTLGFGAPAVSVMVFLRGALCGLAGALLGWGAALVVAGWITPLWFPVTGAKSVPTADLGELGAVVAITLAVIGVATIAPAMFATAQTPASALRDA